MSGALGIVLAAGKGTRMESDLPKVLVPACDRPLVDYVLDASTEAGVDQLVVVVGYKADDVKDALCGRDNISFVEQTEQLGTGHAVQVCMDHLTSYDGPVLVVTGDSPMTQTESIKALLDLYYEQHPACILGTLKKDDPTGLGRIVRDADGNFSGIVEHKDATPEQLEINEVNMSTYVFDCQHLVRALGKLKNDNNQGEYYLTDCPGILKSEGLDVQALPVLKPCEALSVNNLADLSAVEAEMKRLNLVK
ncbi:MAG: NTP transferase domain-containing protein [Planctomycetales bacterium]|nr:NTP transferase domain-containing protein [Planctomycetales bacterium]